MLELKANMSVTILKFLEDRDTVKKKGTLKNIHT